MFDYIKGRLVTKKPTRVVIDAGGLGYDVQVPLSTSSALCEGDEVSIFTHLIVREDQFRLIGFASDGERKLFRHLIAISGIGPQMALTILSHIPVEDFVRAVLGSDVVFLKKIKGIGEKTAQRLVLELKSVSDELIAVVPDAARISAEPACIEEARLALVSLGFTRSVADKAVRRARKDFDEEPTTETLLKMSFRYT